MRSVSHQNKTFDFQYCLLFALRAMGYHVTQCSRTDIQSKKRNDSFESWRHGPVFSQHCFLVDWDAVKRAFRLQTWWFSKSNFSCISRKSCYLWLISCLFRLTLRPIVLVARATCQTADSCGLLWVGAWDWTPGTRSGQRQAGWLQRSQRL